MIVTSKKFLGLQEVLKVSKIPPSSLEALVDFQMTSYAFLYIFSHLW